MSREQSGGTGNTPSSTRCGTHFPSVTAQVLNKPTALSSYLSPHLIWHAVSSSAPLHSWRQTRFSRQGASPRHFARAVWHFCRRQLPTLAASAARAGASTGNRGSKRMMEAVRAPAVSAVCHFGMDGCVDCRCFSGFFGRVFW